MLDMTTKTNTGLMARITRKSVRIAAASLVAMGLIGSTAVMADDYPRTVTDSFGTQTTITSAKRIVALVPSVSDAIFGLGQGDRVIGRTKNADWPADKIKALPNLGSYSGLNVEGVLSLEPDLIIIPDWAAAKEKNIGIFEQFRAAGVDLLVIPERARADAEGKYNMLVLEEFVTLVADALAVPQKGQELIVGMRADAAAAAKLAADSGKKIRVMAMLPYRPTSSKVVGNMKTEALVLELAGAINVGAEAGIPGEKEQDPEALIGMKPDVIVIPQHIWDRADDPVKYVYELPGVSQTAAGENKRFLTWAAVETHRASWRLPAAAHAFAKKLYAE